MAQEKEHAKTGISRWTLEPLFFPSTLFILMVVAAILYFIISGITTSETPDLSWLASLVLAIVIVAGAIIIFSLREPSA